MWIGSERRSGPRSLISLPLLQKSVLTAAGSTFRATVRSRLSFRVPGVVQRLPVSVGQSVRSGDLLAELDPQDYELQVQEDIGVIAPPEPSAATVPSAASTIVGAIIGAMVLALGFDEQAPAAELLGIRR